MAAEHVRLARRRGALTALPRALISMGDAYLREGRFALADDAHVEGRQIAAAMGNPGLPGQIVLPDLTITAAGTLRPLESEAIRTWM